MTILILCLSVLQQGGAKPTVNTLEATAVGTTGMTLNGNLHPHGVHTRYYFEYGATKGYGQRTKTKALPPRLAAYYREDYEQGDGGWSERNSRMPHHKRGGVNNSGFVRYSSPTSNDTNHDDGIGTLHLVSYVYVGPLSSRPKARPSVFLGGGDPDLRGANVSVYVRGQKWKPHGSELIWWSQSQSNLELGTRPGYKRANWGYTGFMLTDLLRSGKWERANYTLRHNSHMWSFGGYNIRTPRPGFDDLLTPSARIPFTRYPYWPLEPTQAHVNYDFFHLLAFVNPKKAPEGAIDFDQFQLIYRNHSLLLPSNGGKLIAAPKAGDSTKLTDGWRNGKNRMWQSRPRPQGPVEFHYSFGKPVTISRLQVHQNPTCPARRIECLASQDGKKYATFYTGTLPEKGTPNDNFAFLIKAGLSVKAKFFKLRILDGYRKDLWGLGEIELFGSGAQMLPDDALYEVNTDIMKLKPGTTVHYRLVAIGKSGTTLGDSRTFTVPKVAKPLVRTGGSSRVTKSRVKIEGRVNPMGRKATYYFEFGTSSKYGDKTPAAYCGRIMVPRTVFANLGRLKSNTTYHYRLVGQNDRGISRGADATFTTK